MIHMIRNVKAISQEAQKRINDLINFLEVCNENTVAKYKNADEETSETLYAIHESTVRFIDDLKDDIQEFVEDMEWFANELEGEN